MIKILPSSLNTWRGKVILLTQKITLPSPDPDSKSKKRHPEEVVGRRKDPGLLGLNHREKHWRSSRFSAKSSG